MDKVMFLSALRDYTRDALRDLLLPVRVQQVNEAASERAPDVYLMRLPDSKAAQKKAPYVLHQIITGKDVQPRGELCDCSCVVRSIFCAFSEDEQEGALHLLNMMERFRIPLLKRCLIGSGGQYELDLQEGLEALIYPDDTAPYYAGEIASTWRMPPVRREVPEIW